MILPDRLPELAMRRGREAMVERTPDNFDSPTSNVGDPSATRRAVTMVSNESTRQEIIVSKASACCSAGSATTTVQNPEAKASRSVTAIVELRGEQESFQMSNRERKCLDPLNA
jgi:hypothetical protein